MTPEPTLSATLRAARRPAPADGSPATSSGRSIVIGWVVLGLIAAVLALQGVWYVVADSEPYPALTQPPFKDVPGADGTYSGQTMSLSVVLSDGSSVPLNLPTFKTEMKRPKDVLFAESWNQGIHVVRSIASHPELDRRSRNQLRAEVSNFVPTGNISYLRIDTQQREYNLTENRNYPISGIKTTFIDLRDAG